jgi:hypothetical protein
MADFSISQLHVGDRDAMGAEVVKIYTKNGKQYAVYRTAEKVVVQVADDLDEAKTQRTSLACLNLLRSEINGLIDGWRLSESPRFKAKAIRYDDRVAASLVMAMEGDLPSAQQTLLDTKQDIIAERSSWARFQYLLWASATGAILYLLLVILGSRCFRTLVYAFPPDADLLWTAAQAGTIGAFFSIAIAIRSRTILTDLRQRDNAADAVLRMLIGVIAAGILLCLLRSGAITTFKIGNADAAAKDPPWAFIVLVGFVAGFFERLVPDMLAKSTEQKQESPAEGGRVQPIAPGKDKEANKKDGNDRDKRGQPNQVEKDRDGTNVTKKDQVTGGQKNQPDPGANNPAS